MIWLGGFSDGEGSFYITRHGKGLDPVYCLTNTNPEMLSLVQELFPFVRVYLRKREEESNQKDTYQVSITNRSQLIEVLNDLIPYLVLKKRQATLLLEYCKRRNEMKKVGNEKRPLGKEEWIIYERLKSLNRKGK